MRAEKQPCSASLRVSSTPPLLESSHTKRKLGSVNPKTINQKVTDDFMVSVYLVKIIPPSIRVERRAQELWEYL